MLLQVSLQNWKFWIEYCSFEKSLGSSNTQKSSESTFTYVKLIKSLVSVQCSFWSFSLVILKKRWQQHKLVIYLNKIHFLMVFKIYFFQWKLWFRWFDFHFLFCVTKKCQTKYRKRLYWPSRRKPPVRNPLRLTSFIGCAWQFGYTQ